VLAGSGLTKSLLLAKRDTQIQENILACFTKGKNINEQRKTMKEESLKGFPGSPSDHQYMKKFRFD
jgi:hypothetical protein